MLNSLPVRESLRKLFSSRGGRAAEEFPSRAPAGSIFRNLTSHTHQENLMARQSLMREFILFLKQEKKWWLIPLVVLLLAVGALLFFAGNSVLAPFIYPFF